LKIPENLKSRLLNELDFVVHKLREEPDTARKLYFLSAAHGAIDRAVHFHLENELLITHYILNVCYSALLDRFNRLKAGEKIIPLPDDWSEQIAQYLSQLSDMISKDQKVYPALEKIIRLTYSATGPGYYTISYLQPSNTS
jgi:hypothetical protein